MTDTPPTMSLQGGSIDGDSSGNHHNCQSHWTNSNNHITNLNTAVIIPTPESLASFLCQEGVAAQLGGALATALSQAQATSTETRPNAAIQEDEEVIPALNATASTLRVERIALVSSSSSCLPPSVVPGEASPDNTSTSLNVSEATPSQLSRNPNAGLTRPKSLQTCATAKTAKTSKTNGAKTCYTARVGTPKVLKFGLERFSDASKPSLLPSCMEPHIRQYMSRDVWENRFVIPLWSASADSFAEKSRGYPDVGDVGIFDENGGFETLLNIFMSEGENYFHFKDCPPGYIPYKKSRSACVKSSVDFVEGAWGGSVGLETDLPESGHTILTKATTVPDKDGFHRGSLMFLPQGGDLHALRGSNLPGIVDFLEMCGPTWYTWLNGESKKRSRNSRQEDFIYTSLVFVARVFVTSSFVLLTTSAPPQREVLTARLHHPKSSTKVFTWEYRSGFRRSIQPSSENQIRTEKDKCVGMSVYELEFDRKQSGARHSALYESANRSASSVVTFLTKLLRPKSKLFSEESQE